MARNRFHLLHCFAATTVVASLANGQVTVSTVALSGSTAPNGDTFETLGGGCVSDDGSVTFTNFYPQSIWKWSQSNGLQLIARDGAVAPGTTGTFVDTRNNIMDAAGNTAFPAGLSGVSIDHDRGIWYGAPGSLSLVAIEGGAAPGTSGALFDMLRYPTMVGGSGIVAYKGLLRGVPAGTAWGVWRSEGGTGTLMARAGATAPGTGSPFIGFAAPHPTSSGSVFFSTSGGNNNSLGIWEHDGSALTSVLTRGPAPGFPTGTNLDFPQEDICANNSGQVAFTFWLTGAPNGALWAMYIASPDGTFNVVATHKQQAIDRPSGDQFHLLQPLAMGDGGQLLFFANLIGDQPCLYFRDSTSTRLIHTGGTAVSPGGPTLTYDYYSYPPIACVNASGNAVIGILSPTPSGPIGAVVGYTAYSGIFPIAQPGTQLEVAPGDIRTVLNAYVPNPDGYRHSTFVLNDSGRCVFHAYFTDGSGGVFVADFGDCRTAARCPADYVADGFVTGEDFDAFVEAFIRGDATADFTADGFTTGEDFDGFVAAFEGGC